MNDCAIAGNWHTATDGAGLAVPSASPTENRTRAPSHAASTTTSPRSPQHRTATSSGSISATVASHGTAGSGV